MFAMTIDEKNSRRENMSCHFLSFFFGGFLGPDFFKDLL